MDLDAEANPADVDDVHAIDGAGADDQDDAERVGQQGEDGDEGGTGEDGNPAEELIELEHDGAKYRVPKALQGAFMMHRDYTGKTMELAEQRRSWDAQKQTREAELQAAEESFQALQAEHRKVGALEATVEEIKAALTPELRHRNAALYQELQLELADAQRNLSAAQGEVEKKTGEFQQRRQAEQANARRELGRTLLREIPGWNPQMARETAEFAVRELGVRPDDLGEIADPRVWKMMHRLRTAEAKLSRLTKSDKIAKDSKSRPAAQVRGGGGQFEANPDTDDFAAFERMASRKLAKA